MSTGNPLDCGCDIAWLITNPEHMDKVTNGATCYDGTQLKELNPVDYDVFC